MPLSSTQELQDSDVIKLLSRHFVALACAYEFRNADGSMTRHSVPFSGFLLGMHGYFFWVTAGHCLDELEKLHARKDIKILGEAFLDSFGYGAVHKEPPPFRYETGCGYHLDDPQNALDFALIPLNPLLIRAFEANNLVPITRENWVHQQDLTFDFYMMLGIPADSVTSKLHDGGTITTVLSTKMLSIDRIRFEDLGDTPSGAEAAPTDAWFIGRLSRQRKTKNIEGMSGGPIYGFRRDRKGRISYHVVALQSRWWDKWGTVFGCSLPGFAELVYQQFKTLMRKGPKGKKKTAVRQVAP
jgi:hypothetical protein